jgi:hypothetical protein
MRLELTRLGEREQAYTDEDRDLLTQLHDARTDASNLRRRNDTFTHTYNELVQQNNNLRGENHLVRDANHVAIRRVQRSNAVINNLNANVHTLQRAVVRLNGDLEPEDEQQIDEQPVRVEDPMPAPNERFAFFRRAYRAFRDAILGPAPGPAGNQAPGQPVAPAVAEPVVIEPAAIEPAVGSLPVQNVAVNLAPQIEPEIGERPVERDPSPVAPEVPNLTVAIPGIEHHENLVAAPAVPVAVEGEDRRYVLQPQSQRRLRPSIVEV